MQKYDPGAGNTAENGQALESNKAFGRGEVRYTKQSHGWGRERCPHQPTASGSGSSFPASPILMHKYESPKPAEVGRLEGLSRQVSVCTWVSPSKLQTTHRRSSASYRVHSPFAEGPPCQRGMDESSWALGTELQATPSTWKDPGRLCPAATSLSCISKYIPSGCFLPRA